MKPVVAICCFCQRVRDDVGSEVGEGFWQEFRNYMAMHNLRPEEIEFSHTYCPSCLAYYRDFLTSQNVAHDYQRVERRA